MFIDSNKIDIEKWFADPCDIRRIKAMLKEACQQTDAWIKAEDCKPEPFKAVWGRIERHGYPGHVRYSPVYLHEDGRWCYWDAPLPLLSNEHLTHWYPLPPMDSENNQ